jgi:uncharacterized protein (TIGR03382 family)
MRTLLLGLIATTSILTPSLAHADQCAWVSKAEAISGARALGATFGASMLEYCEPCGDTDPTSRIVKSVSFSWADEARTFFEVKVNGEGIDMAYTYVQVDTNGDAKNDTWQNLAVAAGCTADGVTPSFPMEGGSKFDEATDEDYSDVSEGGGCSATDGGSTGLFAFAALGLAAVIGRRGRRA